MSGITASTSSRKFDSYEEFEREMLPSRHAQRLAGQRRETDLASRMANQSLDRMRQIIGRSLQKSVAPKA